MQVLLLPGVVLVLIFVSLLDKCLSLRLGLAKVEEGRGLHDVARLAFLILVLGNFLLFLYIEALGDFVRGEVEALADLLEL